ncbi:hypothetical protein [Nocardia sp. NPDC047038]|uniref:hypothetical protein n=1 Tax=Nocardia sp. NPDC047038 TaxID=3154338 RepID=UPI0033D5CD99
MAGEAIDLELFLRTMAAATGDAALAEDVAARGDAVTPAAASLTSWTDSSAWRRDWPWRVQEFMLALRSRWHDAVVGW